MSFSSWFARIADFYPIRKLIVQPIRRHINAFDAASQRCQPIQEALLQRIIRTQQATGFGQDHGFASIRTPADFRKQVPVHRYEDLEPYMLRVVKGDLKALLTEPKIHMFAMTSGTTATRKYIPVTPQYLADYKRGWNIWGVRAYRDHPAVRLKPILQLSGDWEEFHTETGVPCGALTGLTASTQMRMIRWLYCMPGIGGKIKDARSKYYVALRLSMHRKVGMIIAANPSTLVNLARTGDQEKEALLRDLHDGTLAKDLDIPPAVRTALSLPRKPDRARELDAIARRTGHLFPKDYWGPFLVGTWTGGSMGAYLRHFPTYYGDAWVRDIGLLASEGRMTLPFANNTPAGALDITSHYFEFMPEEEADKSNPTVLHSWELQEGKRYFILPTTAYGLYRYQIHDLVQVTGFYNQTPLIQFLSKGAHFSNITGEKLSEYQVCQAMAELTKELDLSLFIYSVAPCWHDDRPYYGLFIERGDLRDIEEGRTLAEALDRRLQASNPEYAAKRESQRLDPIRLEVIPSGSWQEWDRKRLTKTGGTLEQYKHPCLINDLHFREAMPVLQEVPVGSAKVTDRQTAPA